MNVNKHICKETGGNKYDSGWCCCLLFPKFHTLISRQKQGNLLCILLNLLKDKLDPQNKSKEAAVEKRLLFYTKELID